MSTSFTAHTGGSGAVQPAVAERFRDWLTRPTSFDGIFPPAARRLGVIYVQLTVPLITVLSLFASDRQSYLFVFAFLPLVLYGVPTLALSVVALRRAPVTTADRPSYLLWLAGSCLFCAVAVGILVGLATGSHVADPLGWPITLVIGLLMVGGIVRLTRSRSGQRTFSVDAIEAVMAAVVIAAPCALIWGSRIVNAEESWFTRPAGLASVGMILGSYWALALVVRLGPNARTLERCGLAVCLVGAVSAAAQVAQGLSGFTLFAPPLIALHSVCLGIGVLVPLHTSRSSSRGGRARLPPQAQVRAGYLATLVTLVGLPVLVVTTVAVDERTSWAAPFALGTATLLVALAGLRHLAGIRETRHLYHRVEQASHQRHLLLAQVMQRADEDRHRVAAQLHEQAVSAYTSVVLLQGSYTASGTSGGTPVGAGDHVRHDLAHHADSLRDLMLAIKPLGADRGGSRTLAAPIHAYLDNLYGDHPSPKLTVTTAEDLFLDWPTETILLRIVQEALRNVYRHSEATEVEVTIDASHGASTVHISDDGVGFEPTDALESGIATMRAFAAVVEGTIDVESAPRRGCRILARLGAPHDEDADAQLLRLVPNRKLP